MRKSFCLRLTLCWTATTTTGEAELKGFKSDFPALTILRKSSSLSWKTFNYFSAHFSHFFGPHFDGAVERRRQTRIPKLSPTPGELTRQSRAGPGRQADQSMAKVKRVVYFSAKRSRGRKSWTCLLLDAEFKLPRINQQNP